MLEVILDTNVLVSAPKLNRGTSYAIVSQLPSPRFQIALTILLYMEYQDALTRPENMTGASTEEEILGFLRYLCRIAHRQEVFFESISGDRQQK
jgi:predicted nucleic acid-binding protein